MNEKLETVTIEVCPPKTLFIPGIAQQMLPLNVLIGVKIVSEIWT